MPKIRSNAANNHHVFYCPGCKGHHAISNIWQYNNDPDKPTISPSILVNGTIKPYPGMIRCHSFVTDGKIQYLSDCTHDMAGQTVDLPDWPDDIEVN